MQANMVLKNLRKGIRFVAMTCCGVLILSVFVNVVLRYVFNSGIPFGEDLTRYLMVVVVFLQAVWPWTRKDTSV